LTNEPEEVLHALLTILRFLPDGVDGVKGALEQFNDTLKLQVVELPPPLLDRTVVVEDLARLFLLVVGDVEVGTDVLPVLDLINRALNPSKRASPCPTAAQARRQ
jgi:hypothetical protein